MLIFLHPIIASPGGGSSPIFVRGCAISGFETPPFDKERQRRKFDPFVRQIREKVGKNDLKMYYSKDFRKFLPLKSAKHAFLRGETSNLSRKGPCKYSVMWIQIQICSFAQAM